MSEESRRVSLSFLATQSAFLSPCAWAVIGRHAERISVLWCGSAWLGIPHPCSQRVEEQKESLLYAHMNAMSLFMEKRLCLEAL